MVLDVVEIGQSHVVAELRLEHVVTVAGNRQPDTLEHVGGKRENVLLVIDDVERDAEVVGQRLAARQTAETAQYGKRDMAVEPREHSDFAQSGFTAVAVAVKRVGIALQLEPLQRQLQLVEGEDVDENAPVLEATVIGTLVEEGAGVAQLGEEVEIVLVGLVGLQDDVRRQLAGQDLHQPLIVLPHQANIQVVVPGDETIVANSTQQSASVKEIRDIIFAADPVKLLDHVEHDQLLATQG